MTKSELKSIIRECINEMSAPEVSEEVKEVEINEDTDLSLVDESMEFDYKVIEAMQFANQYEDTEIQEGASLDNIKDLHKVLSNNKKAVKEAKKYLKEGNKEEAKKLIKKAISDLKDIRKQLAETDENVPREIVQSIIYLFVPYVNTGVTLYLLVMGTNGPSENEGIRSVSQLLNTIVRAVGIDRTSNSIPVWRTPFLSAMSSYLGWTQFINAIIEVFKSINYRVNHSDEVKNLGKLSIDLLRAIDTYIKMLEAMLNKM